MGWSRGNSLGKLRWEGARQYAGRETVENSLGKLRWEGARPDAGRDEAVEIAWGNCAGKERDWPDAGRDEPVEIARENFAAGGGETGCSTGWSRGNSLGKLRWEGARPDAGRDKSVENSLGKLRWEGARPDGRDEAVEIAWGDFAGRERDRMLDGMKPWK